MRPGALALVCLVLVSETWAQTSVSPSAPFRLDLLPGLTVLSAPPGTGTSQPYTAEDLLRDVGSPFVVRTLRTIGGATRFDVFLAGLGLPAFLLRPGEGYLVRSPATRSVWYSASRIRPSGTIWTVAGNGRYESGGDGGPARLAGLGLPMSVDVDGKGHLYVSDGAFHRIWCVDLRGGSIRSVAGNGATTEDLFFFNDHNRFQLRGGRFSGDGGPATSASINSPMTVRLDAAGNIYLADVANLRIRRIDASTGIIDTVAGNGVLGNVGDGGPGNLASISQPRSFAVDSHGAVFLNVNGEKGSRLRRVDPATRTITTIAGIEGPANPEQRVPFVFSLTDSLPQFNRLRFDARGQLYAFGGTGIVHFDFCSQQLSQVTTSFPRAAPFPGVFFRPGFDRLRLATRMFLPQSDGSFLLLDLPHRLLRWDSQGFIHRVAGDWWRADPFDAYSSPGRYAGDGGPAVEASFDNPEDLAVDTDGTIYVADTDNHVVRAISP